MHLNHIHSHSPLMHVYHFILGLAPAQFAGFLTIHICGHYTVFPGVFFNLVSESGRHGGRKHYLCHRRSPGLSTHWQPHKACLETDDNTTKTTQVAADHLEEKCSV